MPASYNLPRTTGLWNQQDINLYNKLPYYLALLEAKYYPVWHVWDKLFGYFNWEQNMGNILRGVRAEPTPVVGQEHIPNNITEQPLKDVHEVRETSEDARVKRHLYESAQFNFNPSFADFRTNQIKFAMENLTKHIAIKNDFFIRGNVFQKSPFVFISGKAPNSGSPAFQSGSELVNAPTGEQNSTAANAPKNTAWLQEAVSLVGNSLGNCSYKVVKKVKTIMAEDFQAPAFEGQGNMPQANEVLKGKYCFIGSNEAFEYMSFDEHILANRMLNTDLLTSEFSGAIGSHIVWKSERFPLRIAADGTFPAPQIWQGAENVYNFGETLPNPSYVNAPFEVAFMIAADAYRSIKVGAPPKEFAKGVTSEKFAALKWNGEVRLTDNILINMGNNVYDTNKYGEFLQLIADTVHGIIPVNRRYVIPVIYRRVRVATN